MALRNDKANDREWLFVGDFDDNDGHRLNVWQSIYYPWVKLEVHPSPKANETTPYVLTVERWRAIGAAAFPEEFEHPALPAITRWLTDYPDAHEALSKLFVPSDRLGSMREDRKREIVDALVEAMQTGDV
jgi:hypothetical protein